MIRIWQGTDSLALILDLWGDRMICFAMILFSLMAGAFLATP
ncbi:hypothetical protein [Mesobaculum littorinae]|nr:hypothetical protein [Mesobaculum littorinae]